VELGSLIVKKILYYKNILILLKSQNKPRHIKIYLKKLKTLR